MKPQERTYRDSLMQGDRRCFKVMVKETDLLIHAPKSLKSKARDSIIKYRGQIESFIASHPEFASSLSPVAPIEPAPEIVRKMIKAGGAAGVGPMAAVAGAVSEYVGSDLLNHTDEIIVENGGDIFMKKKGPAKVAVFAGKSPLSMKIGIMVQPGERPLAVCTSSGTVGHSLSFGTADAVCVVSRDTPLADAVATSLGNRVKSRDDIRRTIDLGKTIPGVLGLLIISGKHMGAWGDLELSPV